jgi:hypothetical protein
MGKPITQDRMDEALEYLLETDELCAALGADCERLEFKAKRTKAAIFNLTDGKSATDRESKAGVAPEVEKAYDEYFKALEKFNTVRNKRATETIVFEAWRSLNSNRRQGS